MNLETTRCWAEIDRSAIRQNARTAKSMAGQNAQLMAVIKANAYGHGLAEIARSLTSEADLFGVANLEEAVVAREAVTDTPVLILGPSLPAERREICERGFIASVSSLDDAASFASLATRGPARLNLVIDTGMGRMGCAGDNALETLARVLKLPNVVLHSVSTHLPVADEDAAFTENQLRGFEQLVRQMRAQAPGDYRTHALLSAGVLAFHAHRFEIVRAGLMLYGIAPLPEFQARLRPAMTLKSRVVLVRDLPAGAPISYGRTFITPRPMRVATIGAGYADGYPRALSNRDASVLIAGRRCAVLGRVTMDLIVADVSSLPETAPGDEVVLIGRQGEEEVSATELATRAGTIAWDILTGIGTRVRRVYL